LIPSRKIIRGKKGRWDGYLFGNFSTKEWMLGEISILSRFNIIKRRGRDEELN